jgi:hypothetical protein
MLDGDWSSDVCSSDLASMARSDLIRIVLSLSLSIHLDAGLAARREQAVARGIGALLHLRATIVAVGVSVIVITVIIVVFSLPVAVAICVAAVVLAVPAMSFAMTVVVMLAIIDIQRLGGRLAEVLRVERHGLAGDGGKTGGTGEGGKDELAVFHLRFPFGDWGGHL